MVTFVLAGVLGSVLAVGETAAGSAQSRPLPSGGLEAAGAARALPEEPARAPYRRLFSDPAESGEAVGPHRLIRFGQKQTPGVSPDAADGGPCRLVEPSVRNDIDPGIFAPLGDPQIDFTIRRIVPKGCIDPGIFIPKRQR